MVPPARSLRIQFLVGFAILAAASLAGRSSAADSARSGALAVHLSYDWGGVSDSGVVVEASGEQAHLRLAAADRRGLATFPALPPGLFLVTAREAVSGRITAIVRPGETTDVDLGTSGIPGEVFRRTSGESDGTGVLAIRLMMAAAWEDTGTTVSIRAALGRASTGRTDACGRVFFTHLPAGPVDITCGRLLWNRVRAATIRPGDTTFVRLLTHQHGIIPGLYGCCLCETEP